MSEQVKTTTVDKLPEDTNIADLWMFGYNPKRAAGQRSVKVPFAAITPQFGISQSLDNSITTAPSNKIVKEAIDSKAIYPYKEGELGKNIPILKNAIKGLYIYPEYMLEGYEYRISSILRTAERSQITLYSIAPNTGALTQIERFETDGDADNGEAILYKGRRFSIVIDWGEIPLGSSFTNMKDGYELDALCFSKSNPLDTVLNASNWNYPYKLQAEGVNIGALKRAIKNVFVHPHIMEQGKKYYLTTVRRNHVNETTKIKESQLSIWSKRESDGATSPIEILTIEGDAANGAVQLVCGNTFIVEINWDALSDGIGLTSMFDGYELDDKCFSYKNELYANRSASEASVSRALPSAPKLPFFGYVDTRNGGMSSAPNFKTSDYIKVRKGQKIRYIGDMYGNAGICGYPTKAVNGFVVLHDSNKYSAYQNHPLNKIVELEIPEGVEYIRVCNFKEANFRLEWINAPESVSESNDSETINTKNINVTGGQLETETFALTTQILTTRWLELSENHDLPTKGVFIARRANDILVSINGVLKKLNLVDL